MTVPSFIASCNIKMIIQSSLNLFTTVKASHGKSICVLHVDRSFC